MLKGSPSPTPTKWARVKVASAFYNGISLYAEQEEAGGNAAIMGHTVIRATPREVFEAILGFEISFDSATQGCTVLETYMEDSTQVLPSATAWKPWTRWFNCAPLPVHLSGLQEVLEAARLQPEGIGGVFNIEALAGTCSVKR